MTKQTLNGNYRRLGLIALMLSLTQLAQVHGRQAQERPPSAPPTSPGSEQAGLTSGPDYRIGVGDLIEVRVDKAQELSGTYRVTSNGTIQMHFLGSIVAQNKSPEQLSTLIADGLRGRYLKSPNVVVEIRQRYYRPKVFVQGAVRSPGAYDLEGKVSLLKLISLCGGLADNHGSSAFIFRAAHPSTASTEPISDEPSGNKTPRSSDAEASPDYVFTPVSITGLLRGNLAENVLIEPFDIVNIPTADVFFVAGEVRSPGAFPLNAGTTLRQAISLAQGTTMQAATGRAMIFRDDPATGQRIDMKVDIGAVMEGKAKDLPISANDVIIVPNSKLKSMGAALLRSLGGVPYHVIGR